MKFPAFFSWLFPILLTGIVLGCSKAMIYRIDTTITSPPQAQANTFEDDQIAVSFQMTHHAITMTLKNKTSHPLKILWTQSSFIDMEGQPQGITHTGYRHPPRGVVSTPSVSTLAPGGNIRDQIIPFKRLGPERKPKPSDPFFEGLEVGAGRWPEEKIRKTYIGKTFSLLLMVQTNRVTPYRFLFRIDSFELVQTQ